MYPSDQQHKTAKIMMLVALSKDGAKWTLIYSKKTLEHSQRQNAVSVLVDISHIFVGSFHDLWTRTFVCETETSLLDRTEKHIIWQTVMVFVIIVDVMLYWKWEVTTSD